MNTTDSQPTSSAFDVAKLIDRIKLVLFSPNECWSTIANETTSPKELAINLVAPLAITSSICTFLGMQLFGFGAPFFSSLIFHIVTVILQIGGTFLAALIIQKLSPNFNGSDDYTRAYSLLAHSMIPSLLSGILGLVPFLLPLGVLFGLYAIYLFYAGTTKMLDIPGERRIVFVAASIIIIMVVMVVIGSVANVLNGPSLPPV